MTPSPSGRPMSYAASMRTSRCCCAGRSKTQGVCRSGLGHCPSAVGHPPRDSTRPNSRPKIKPRTVAVHSVSPRNLLKTPSSRVARAEGRVRTRSRPLSSSSRFRGDLRGELDTQGRSPLRRQVTLSLVGDDLVNSVPGQPGRPRAHGDGRQERSRQRGPRGHRAGGAIDVTGRDRGRPSGGIYELFEVTGNLARTPSSYSGSNLQRDRVKALVVAGCVALHESFDVWSADTLIVPSWHTVGKGRSASCPTDWRTPSPRVRWRGNRGRSRS